MKIRILLVDFFPKLLGMKKPLRRRDNKQRQFQKSFQINHSSNSSNIMNGRNILFENIQNSLPEYNSEEKNSDRSYTDKEINLLKYNLECILKEMKFMTMKIMENEEEEDKSLDWYKKHIEARNCLKIN